MGFFMRLSLNLILR